MNATDKRIIKRIIHEFGNIELLKVGISEAGWKQVANAMREGETPTWQEVDKVADVLKKMIGEE